MVTGDILNTLAAVVGVGNTGVMLLLFVDGAVDVEIAAVDDVFITEVKGAAIGGGAHSGFGFFLRRTFRAI